MFIETARGMKTNLYEIIINYDVTSVWYLVQSCLTLFISIVCSSTVSNPSTQHSFLDRQLYAYFVKAKLL